MQDCIVRSVEKKESNLLLSISETTFIEAFANYNSETDMNLYRAENFTLQKIEAELENPDSQFFFAEHASRVVGYLKVNINSAQTEVIDESTLEIERIYVLAEYYGKGIAQQLFHKAKGLAIEKGLKYIWLGVWDENQRAMRFYNKMGFVDIGHHPFKLGLSLQTDILMKLEL